MVLEIWRENNTSQSRGSGFGDRHSSRGAEDREMSLGRDTKRDRSRDRDPRRERSLDIDQRRSRDWEGSRERDQSKERDRERSRDMNYRRERDQERSKDKRIDIILRENQERSRDRDTRRDENKRSDHEDRRIEKQQDRSLDRVVYWYSRRDREDELDERRKKERERSKEDSARASDIPRDRESEMEKDRDRYYERDGVKERDRETQRERRDRSKDKGRDFKSDSTKLNISNHDSLEGSRGQLDSSRDGDEQDDFEKKVTLKLAEQEEDLYRVKESRKRRLAILEKYKNKQMQRQQKETQSVNMDKDVNPAHCTVHSLPASNVASETLDIRVEDTVYDVNSSFSLGKSSPENIRQVSQRNKGASGLGEGTPKSERSDEKYCDDIFGETPAGVRRVGKADGLPIVHSGANDNWDDADGYYGYRYGETLDGRYEVVAAHGKGVFSTVVRAKNLKAGTCEPEEVVIKIIHNNETMHKAGQSEVHILNKLTSEDPENKRHCVRFLSSFKYRNHLRLVFESLHMNLREILKMFGRNIGLKF